MTDERSSMDDARPRLRIFCDFDGTIVDEDVGDTFFSTFSGPEMWTDNKAFLEGKYGAAEVFQRYSARMRGITKQAIDEFCAAFHVREDFPPFAAWCETQHIPLLVISDGMDVYIRPLLAAASLRVQFRSNAFIIRDDASCAVRRVHADEHCARCGTCKRNIMLASSGDAEAIVLIGDGTSDFCPAAYADIVFAKGELERYCQRENITYRSFSDFNEVRMQLEQLLRRGRVRRPRHAALQRAAAWMAE